jgi:hypothetical protein
MQWRRKLAVRKEVYPFDAAHSHGDVNSSESFKHKKSL